MPTLYFDESKFRQRLIDSKRATIQKARIDACDTLLDYLHDDVPWKDQQPLMDLLRWLRNDLESEMDDALTP